MDSAGLRACKNMYMIGIPFTGLIMEASILDLRYRMKEVLQALDRREKVRILYHGKEKGTIIPSESGSKTRIKEHPFFGMKRKDKRTVKDVMGELRRGRYDAL